jgi:hypothetical protein
VLYNPNAASTQPSRFRHRCRNVRCGAKLKTPTGNPHAAFCCRGRFDSFYRTRCRVCERPIDHKTKRRLVCKRSECRHEFQRRPECFSGPTSSGSGLGHISSRNPIKPGLKIGTKPGRPFRIVAGPGLTETSFRLATIPLDPQFATRLDRLHADYVTHRRKAAWHARRAAQIKRRLPPVNVLGGYRFPGAPALDMSPIDPPPEWAIPSRWVPTGTGAIAPDIPDFLRRGALPAILVITPALTEARL